jgi:hypothetical protein
VALGNAPPSRRIVQALEARRPGLPELVAEHVDWALGRQRAGLAGAPYDAGPGGASAAATSAGGRRIVRR